MRALAAELRAEGALVAATGRLEEFRDRPDHELWRMFADETVTTAGFTRIVAEIKAAPEGTTWPRLRVVGYVIHVLVFLPKRLAYLAGRKATVSEIGSGYLAALRRGADLLRSMGVERRR